jgi:hypothetical protein
MTDLDKVNELVKRIGLFPDYAGTSTDSPCAMDILNDQLENDELVLLFTKSGKVSKRSSNPELLIESLTETIERIKMDYADWINDI